MENIKVFIVDLPERIAGMTVRTYDCEDFYCILLNAKLSREQLIQAYEHEIQHIDEHDFDSMYTADEIERIRQCA